MKNYSYLLLLLFVCGCGDGVQVKGTVKFDDGQLLTVGFVNFTSETTEAVGAIKANGTYVLGRTKPGDGVTPGHYKVAVVGAMINNGFVPATAVSSAPTGGGPPRAPLPPTYLIDRKFEHPSTSGLTCEVKGAMTYDIIVTKP